MAPKWSSRPHKKRVKRLSFRVTQEELHWMTREANRRQVSLSDLVRQALEWFLGKS